MLNRILVALFLLITGVTLAQEGTVSPYSFYGIGTTNFKGTAENRAMGGISVFTDSIHLSVQNPAGVANLRLMNFSIGASHNYVKQKTDNETRTASTSTLDYLIAGIPMGKFGASFGLIPSTAVGYDLISTEDGFTSTYTGTGGLNRTFLVLAYSVTPQLNVGVDVNYNFGNIENTTLTDFGVQYGTREINKSDLSGFSYNFGATYRTMVSDYLEFTSMATYTPETNFKSENYRLIATVLITDIGTTGIVDEEVIPLDDTDFTYPSQYTLGAGIGSPKSWFLGGEFTHQKVSNFENRTFQIPNQEFKDANKFRLGGYVIPNYNAIGNYWKRVVYRGGLRFEETGNVINGQDINEFGISFGVGLPLGRVFSNVNLSFEVGRRGTTDSGLVKENFINTFLSLSLNDKWFEKRFFD